MSARYQQLDRGVWDFQTRTRVMPEDAAWQDYRIWLTTGGVPLPVDALGQDDLAIAKTKRIEEINAHCAGLRNQIVAGRSVGEMASWAMKLMDAIARTAAQPSPFLSLMPGVATALGLPTTPAGVNDAMAMVRGISEEDYIAKVMRDAGQYIAAEIALDAIRGKHCDAVEAMTDVRDLLVYDWRACWPVL